MKNRHYVKSHIEFFRHISPIISSSPLVRKVILNWGSTLVECKRTEQIRVNKKLEASLLTDTGSPGGSSSREGGGGGLSGVGYRRADRSQIVAQSGGEQWIREKANREGYNCSYFFSLPRGSPETKDDPTSNIQIRKVPSGFTNRGELDYPASNLQPSFFFSFFFFSFFGATRDELLVWTMVLVTGFFILPGTFADSGIKNKFNFLVSRWLY